MVDDQRDDDDILADSKIGRILPMLALDEIPNPNADASRIVALVKDGGSVTGYQLSDGRIVSREQGVNLAKEGEISGVGIAHKKETEYLKSLPDGTDDNNLSHLPSISAKVDTDKMS